MAWGGLLFPNPETSFASSLADVPDNNNITGFKDARVDELLGRLRPRVRSAEARRDHPGDRRHPGQLLSVHLGLGRAVQPHRLLEQVRPARGLPHARRRLPRHSDALVDRSAEGGGAAPRARRQLRDSCPSARPRFATGPNTATREGSRHRSMTAYFVRRFLLIIPTFLGITSRSFVVMQFVPGGPVERADHELPDGRDDRRRRRRIGDRPRQQRAARGARSRRSAATTASTSRCTFATACGCGTCCTSTSAARTCTKTRLGRHQVAFPGLDLPRAHRVLPGLPGLRAARRPQGRAPRLALRLDQQRRRVLGLRDSRAGRSARRCSCSSAAAASGTCFRSAAFGPTTGST